MNGYEVISVNYAGLELETFSESQLLSVLAKAKEVARGQLEGIDFAQYEKLIFVSKSIVTVVGAICAKQMGVKPYHIMITPFNQAFQFVSVIKDIAATLDESIYDFEVMGRNQQHISMSQYKEKVLLIVNTATGCGFTPQYQMLEQIYKKYKNQGFEFLKLRKGFKGFDMSKPESKYLVHKLEKEEPGYELSSDIKWNFTKFLVNRQGQVIERFELTTDLTQVEEAILQLL